ncbi:MAG TPA: rhodanese-like domain-containing protein [Candidatus Limiplasma sp.]|nr:rhodanese-like domain-containing protein [Candidatus Limiplasma sp.]
MKKLLALLLSLVLLVTVSVVALAESETSSVVAEKAMEYLANYDGSQVVIKPADLFAKMDAGDDMLILDVRQADAYEAGHLIGAVNVPFGMAIPEALANIPDDVQVYVYCYTGQTASQTTALLNVAGKYAANIQSGFNNGISQAEGYEAYITTDVYTLTDDTYDVDPDVQAAITTYFEEMVSKADTAFKYNNFKASDLYDILDAEVEGYFVYDVRQADAYAAGHIAGAINNPFGAGMQENFAAQLPTDETIIVHCYTGQTASQTVAILRLLGYDAYNLSGGMNNGWLAAGYETVTE